MIFIYTFKRIDRGFNYYFDKILFNGEEIYLKIPDVSFSKTQISEIGFQADDGISLYATISENPDDAKWEKISSGDDINKSISCIKAVSSTDNQRLIIRVMMC